MAQQILNAWVGESELYDIDCSFDLDTTETITSITGISAVPTGLTFSGQVVNTVAVTYKDGTTAAIGKVVQVRIAGFISRQRYDIELKVATSKGGAPKIAHVDLKVGP